MSDSTPRPLIADSLEAEVNAQESFNRAKRGIQRSLALRSGLREGTLTYEQFCKLPRAVQKIYAQRFGKPLSAPEAKQAKERKAKEKKARKAATKAKRRNRR